MTDTRERKTTGGARAAARLGAVQALFQIEQAKVADPRLVVDEFRSHRLGKEVEGDLYAAADEALFEDIVLGTTTRLSDIDRYLGSVLAEGWPLPRLDSVLRAILRAATYELLGRPDIPTKVIINEYVDMTHAFESGAEPAFVNGVLDRLGRELRS